VLCRIVKRFASYSNLKVAEAGTKIDHPLQRGGITIRRQQGDFNDPHSLQKVFRGHL
jgi:hypothetical protein